MVKKRVMGIGKIMHEDIKIKDYDRSYDKLVLAKMKNPHFPGLPFDN